MANHLAKNLFTDKVEEIPTRNGYGEGLVEAGKANENVIVLCADLTESTRSLAFAEAYPKRFVEVGVAEQNMATLAAGFAMEGKIPFMSSYATFSPGRNNEQIRTSIALNESNVKIAGAHAGISVGPDGATHQALEDIALMRVVPNMTVLVPCDYHETRKATIAAAKHDGPVYLRFARAATPVITTKSAPFEIGKAQILREGKDVTLIASGPVLYEGLLAAEELEDIIDVEVINAATIKPFDQETLLASAKKTGAVVTLEEHQINGGLGSVVAETLGENLPTPMKRIGIQDRFGESGDPRRLLKEFGLTAPSIKKVIQQIHGRKK
ncbi:transketolase family protein [Patescibacteria group bacterium]